MKLEVVRTQFGKDATNGMLFIDGVFECYTLEDEVRDVKVYGETAIPSGEYEIKFRKVGGFHERYSARYKNAHYGMLELQDVPNFKYILIHSGNTDEHTAGCLLVGNTQQDLDLGKDGMIGQSRLAYERMYRKVSAEMLAGQKVTIKISDIQLDNQISNKSDDDNFIYPSYKEKLDQIYNNTNIIKNYIIKGIAPQ